MENYRNISISAFLSLAFGHPRTFLSMFSGAFVSMICWLAISDGAPLGFSIVPAVFALVAISPILSIGNRYELLSRGILSNAKVKKSRGQNIFTSKREVHVSTFTFSDEKGATHEFDVKVLKPKKARARDRIDLTKAGVSVAIIYLPENPSGALLLEKAGSNLIFSNEEVGAPVLSTTILLIPVMLFVFINFYGLIALLV